MSLTQKIESLFTSGKGLVKLLKDYSFETVLDVGSGAGKHADFLREAGKIVDTVDLGTSFYAKRRKGEISFLGDFLKIDFEKKYDCLFCSHILEHTLNVNEFLKKVFSLLKNDGILLISVPPVKTKLVGGHVNQFTPATLFYHLILAGFDCGDASYKAYGYNQTVIVKKRRAVLPEGLTMDTGDIKKLQSFFPKGLGVKQEFEFKGRDINWE
jgi:SAM-dependent methyltransferase